METPNRTTITAVDKQYLDEVITPLFSSGEPLTEADREFLENVTNQFLENADKNPRRSSS